MDSSIPFLTSMATISFFFFLTTLPPQSACHEDYGYWVCSNQSYNCGTLTNISYPFFGENRPSFCGRAGLELVCVDNQTTKLIVDDLQRFTVFEINQMDHRMRMVPEFFQNPVCPWDYKNVSLSRYLLKFRPTVHNVSIFYYCSSGFSIGGNNFSCVADSWQQGFYVDENVWWQRHIEKLIQNCSGHIQVHAMQPIGWVPAGGIGALKKALDAGFDVQYDLSDCHGCQESGGACGSRRDDPFLFFCYEHELDAAYAPEAEGSNNSNSLNWKRKIIIGRTINNNNSSKRYSQSSTMKGVTVAAVSALLVGICCCRYKPSILKRKYWNMKNNDKDIEAFIRNHGTLALRRYKFSDVKKMTNSFKVKLGQGGFGAVYKGKLVTGSPVAVKILNASKGNGEEFINEVASISRTSHVNVVALLGFCFEGRKKALIYEFMANGSLEKFIHKTDDGTSLSWEKLYQIAVGIARGLEYLHKGCSTRILHFDIKPHNVLLDDNFCPKISDFGLAKLCLTRESIISMSEARGTLGYIAPEVWNKNFGGVSHKSDVYSYGMMLLEMVGGRKNINAEANQTSEIYFPDWIYKKLELGLGLDGVMTSEENNTAKRMTSVGLWCIQTIPSHRPTMSRVIEMLEGSLDSLEMPPKPVLSSPTRSTPESSTT